MQRDPDQLENLAEAPGHAGKVEELSGVLKAKLVETRDPRARMDDQLIDPATRLLIASHWFHLFHNKSLQREMRAPPHLPPTAEAATSTLPAYLLPETV